MTLQHRIRSTGVSSAWGGLFVAVGMVASALIITQRQTVTAVPPSATAEEISSVFRAVAAEATPCVVSIISVTKPKPGAAPQADDDEMDQFPLPDLFRDDPQLRRFFDLPRGGQRRGQRMPQQERVGEGSGFVIDPAGIIMTNNHVVEGATELTVRFSDGREYKTKNWKTDPKTDVAIVRIEGATGLRALQFGDSSNAFVGDWVLAIGSPFGLETSVTAGIISAKSRPPGIIPGEDRREDFIQTDAAINPGNSGGPLLNLRGEVIGINTAISSRGGGNDGVGFAIPINMASWVGRQLISDGKVKRAWLGIKFGAVSQDLANKIGVEVGKGAFVSEVRRNTPAERAGLEPGDVIVSLNGVPLNESRSLQQIVERLEVGRTFPLEVIREGKKVSLKFTAEALPEDLAITAGDAKTTRSSTEVDRLGVEVADLNDELAKKYQLDLKEGVVVTGVAPNGIGARAGLEVGDIVEKFARKSIRTAEEFRAAAKELKESDEIMLSVRTKTGRKLVVISGK